MHRILIGFIYLISCLPFFMLYGLSDFIYFILYRVVGYRKKIIEKNLLIAFPEKTNAERNQIKKKFYKNFSDTWIEVIKLMTISKKNLEKRVTFDYQELEKIYATGRSVQGFAGHIFNWEVINAHMPSHTLYNCIAIYMPISNKAIETLFLKLRSRFGTHMLKAGEMKEAIKPWRDKQYIIGVAADQSPSRPEHAYWLNFFNTPTAFVTTPWKQAIKLNQPVIYLSMQKPKRGRFHFSTELLIENPIDLSEKEVAIKFIQRLEKEIKENPPLYLWSHKRWKFEWNEAYLQQWMDDKPPVSNTPITSNH